MAGNYEKCMARKRMANGRFYWVCFKKKGHHTYGGRDNRSHVDYKQNPGHRWESGLPACGVAECIEPPDEYNPRNTPEKAYCDLHWLEITDRPNEEVTE